MKDAREWVRSLPLANPYESARQLVARIERWNQEKEHAAKQRFAAMEELAPGLDEVFRTLHRDLVDVAFPMRSRQQKAADLVDHLRLLVSEGYELVLNGSDAPESGVLGKHFATLWTQAAQRVFYYAAPLLSERKRLNMRNNDGLWVRLHGIFRLAHRHGVDSLKIPLPPPLKGKKSIGLLYREGLLLSLLPVQEVRREQREEIEATIEQWAEAVDIRLMAEVEEGGQIDFVIDYNRDQGPIGFSGDPAESKAEKWLVVSMVALNKLLKRLVKEHGTEEGGVEVDRHNVVSRRTLSAISHVCKPAAKRNDVRIPTDEKAQAYITFGAVHHQLEDPAGSRMEEVEYVLPGEGGNGDHSNFANRDLSRQWELFCIEVDIVDISANGLRMELDGGRDMALRVGDVVGVKREQDEVPLIGHIRWLEVMGGTRLAAGVFVWCINPRKAMLVAKSPDRTKSKLPAMVCEHSKTGKTLVFAPYISGIRKKRLNLLMRGKRLPLKLRGRPVEHSQAFAAYEFSVPLGWEQGKHRQLTDLSMMKLERLLEKAS